MLKRILALVLFALVPMVFYVWEAMEVVRYSYQLDQLNEERDHLKQVRRMRMIERATLRSLQRIERKAQKDLGLRTPKPDHVVVVEWSEGSKEVNP